jgi:hypothetical protein
LGIAILPHPSKRNPPVIVTAFEPPYNSQECLKRHYFSGGFNIMPLLHLDINDIFIGAIFGFILALPLSLFLTFWLSAVKKRAATVFGAFFAALIAFVIILVWANTLPDANGAGTFFGSLFFCSIAALIGGIFTDLLIARTTSRDYHQSIAHE